MNTSKPTGWFSRRHQTNAAHVKAQDARRDRLAASHAAARARQIAADERKALHKTPTALRPIGAAQ
jgi:hypothetical protein